MRSRPFTAERPAVDAERRREWPGPPHPAVVDVRVPDRGAYLVVTFEWLLFSALAAAVTDALQRTIQERRDRPQPYAEATRLLTQLRTVARQLPGATLDPGGLAEHLIEEVRALATNEERQRLAREIHDGVAQELVMVGYGIDNTLAVLPPDAKDATDELRTLRNEVTRVITELRLSLFELRSEVDRHGGLTAAIAEYARAVGAQAGLRVHLSLDESTARLPAATEAELLRIAQEAITNARKHAGASNLWVTCAVDPPFAQIEVSDDGHGISDQRPDGRYGLAIMAERAERIRGRLEITPRNPNGTRVTVVLGSSV